MDKYFNINTSGWNDWHGSVNFSLHYYRNEPTSYEVLERLIEEYPIYDTDHLVDVGCGKGRALFFFVHQTNCFATGVEYNEPVYQQLNDNLINFNAKHACGTQIRIQHQAAELYHFKPDQNIVYFFNPFTFVIFKKVMENLMLSLEQHPRELDVILYYPQNDYIHYLEKTLSFYKIDSINLHQDDDDRERIDIFRYFPIDIM
ncbi:class I SAM-dependent methyltransferase [Aerococcaceae bacterium DSM 111020]|nr:class I SAM-dependent methyltransferase [Aerococcaceae bacterium DSM 111020]